MFKHAMIFRGNANEHDASAGTDDLDRLLDGFAAPSGLEDNVHLGISREWFCAKLTGEFDPVRQRVADKYLARTSQLDGLDEQQTDRSRTENGHAVTVLNLGEIGGVQGHAQWFEHRGGNVVDGFRHRETGFGRHANVLREAAIIRKQAAEMKAAAKIGMITLAEIAAVTWLRRIDCDTHTGAKVFHVPTDGIDDTGKFVAENERRLENCVADARVGIRVQIATADTGNGDTNQNLAGAGLAGVRNAFEPDVARPVQSCCQHLFHHGRTRPPGAPSCCLRTRTAQRSVPTGTSFQIQ